MMGEHGEHVVPVFSKTTVRGESIELSDGQRQQVLDYIRDIPYEVMRQRGPDESSRWVSGRGAAAIAHAIRNGGTDDPVCLSVPLNGEYGYDDVCLSVPVELSANGWDSIEDWSLSPWEKNRLDAAYDNQSTSPLN
jgi:malate dehydrogenase